jgi:hypothetical protein
MSSVGKIVEGNIKDDFGVYSARRREEELEMVKKTRLRHSREVVCVWGCRQVERRLGQLL